jgi:hypothetical protein
VSLHQRSAARRPSSLLITAALILLFVGGWLIVRTAVLASAGGSTSLTRRLAPDAEINLPSRPPVDPAERAEYRATLARIAARHPHSPRPYLDLGQLELSEGKSLAGLRALIAAGDNNPSYLPARLQLLGAYVAANRPDLAILEADAAMRLSPSLASRLGPILPALATTPAGRATLDRIVTTSPSWRRRVIGSGRGAPVDPSFIYALIQSDGSDPARDREVEQTAFLTSLLGRGDTVAAQLAFINFLPPNAATRDQAVYDGEFDGLPGPPPLNWTLGGNRVDRVSFTKAPDGSGALALSFFDDRAVDLASQITFLPPGRYRLSTLASASRRAAGARLVWSLTCAVRNRTKGKPAIELELAPGSQPSSGSTEFAIPPGDCAFQRLLLRTRASGEPATRDALIHSVAIRPVTR